MKWLLGTLVLCVPFLTLAPPAKAANPWGEITEIVEIWNWSGANTVLLKTESESYCRILANTVLTRQTLALVLAAHLNGSLVMVHCDPEEQTFPGMPNFYELKRIVLYR